MLSVRSYQSRLLQIELQPHAPMCMHQVPPEAVLVEVISGSVVVHVRITGVQSKVTSDNLASRVVGAFETGEIHQLLPSFPVAHASFDYQSHFRWTEV